GKSTGIGILLYFGLVTLAVSVLFGSLVSMVGDTVQAYLSPDQYPAVVVDHTSHESTITDSNGFEDTITVYTPIVEFTNDSGELIRVPLDHSSSSPIAEGEHITVQYSAGEDSATN